MARAYRFVLLLLLFARLDLGPRALAEVAPVPDRPALKITLGDSTAPLYGPWKFQIGDSPIDPTTGAPLWAEPGFDDSRWETVDLTPQDTSLDPVSGVAGVVPGWTARGHAGTWGYGWYRIHLRIETRPGETLAIAGPPIIDDAYQLFLNGRVLGSFGNFSSVRPAVYEAQPMMFPLPLSPNDTNQLLAFRVWMEPYTLTQAPDAGGLRTAPLLGQAGAVSPNHQLRWLDLIRSNADLLVLAPIFALLAIVAFSLTLFDRSDRVYLWLGAVFLMTAVFDAVVVLVATTRFVGFAGPTVFLDVLLRPLRSAAWVMVWWRWFRLRRPGWLPCAVAILAGVYGISALLGEGLFYTLVPPSVGALFGVVSLVVRLLFLLLSLVCVVQGIRQEGLEGWSVLPAVLLLGVATFAGELNFLPVPQLWFVFGVPVGIADIANLLLVAAIAGLLLRRLLVTVRRQRLIELDVKQAQEVQRMIVPEAVAALPGLTIESEYRPALEVGGDFFQILPHPSDGSLLVVAGDVSGKGLQAGMLVALLVGAIRTAAQFNPDPLAVLEVLNERLCGRGQAHATCLALRIAADGAATLVNAGHLPPYLNGQPVPVEGSLPLGMIQGAEFSSSHFRLAEGDHLLLMSDGIVEATDANGKLFGFDRVHDLLRKEVSAAAVASAAQEFGQEDDISVIAITRTAVQG